VIGGASWQTWRMLGPRTSVLLHWVWVILGIALIALARAPLVERYRANSKAESVSLLLSPEHTIALSLGHREALADYLFANLLVQYGLSFQERQRFEPTYNHLDTITTLAPTFDRPYLYADTLLTLRPTPAVLDDYLHTRQLHERGEKALPYHTELWSVAGQFAAYLAQQHVPEPYKTELRLAGARDMARACELASNNANIPYHCIAAAKILNRDGQREAVIRMLSRTLAVNDDPQVRELALAYLEQAVSEREKERYAGRLRALEAAWKEKLPHASRIMMSLLGPGPEVWSCAGAKASGSARCQTNWRDWGEVMDRTPS
jgi:tetratricopeptide (TPR) repeat protein